MARRTPSTSKSGGAPFWADSAASAQRKDRNPHLSPLVEMVDGDAPRRVDGENHHVGQFLIDGRSGVIRSWWRDTRYLRRHRPRAREDTWLKVPGDESSPWPDVRLRPEGTASASSRVARVQGRVGHESRRAEAEQFASRAKDLYFDHVGTERRDHRARHSGIPDEGEDVKMNRARGPDHSLADWHGKDDGRVGCLPQSRRGQAGVGGRRDVRRAWLGVA